MFRRLHERKFGGYCLLLQMWVGLRMCVPVVPPEDGQVMPETCRDIEPQ
jgi:hypothetical protein